MDSECEIVGPWPDEMDWHAVIDRALAALIKITPELNNPRLSVSILLTDDAQVHALNRQWRDKDKPTNVLSFPMMARADLLALPLEGPPEMLGDVALALETCAREANEKRVPLEHHLSHLIIHGMLHLAGYDHETSEADASAMEALEIKTLALMGLADPYGDREA